MRLDFIGKTVAKIVNVNVLALKVGQTELKPAITLRLKVTSPNNILDKLDPTLRKFLFEKGSNAATQGTLDGVPPVSDLPQLTNAAKMLGDLGWGDEQTGCTLIIHRAVSEPIKLKDGTVDKVKISPSDGGSVDIFFDFYVSDLDAETMGELAVLHQHEVDMELELPEPLQRPLEQKKPKAPRQTPEQALAAQLGQTEGQPS